MADLSTSKSGLQLKQNRRPSWKYNNIIKKEMSIDGKIFWLNSWKNIKSQTQELKEHFRIINNKK